MLAPVAVVQAPVAARTSTAGSSITVAWHEANVVTRDLVEFSMAAVSDVCRGTWQVAWRQTVPGSPFLAAGLLPGHCYRWRIEAAGSDGSIATATSGQVWVLPRWTGTVNLYRAGVFATQATYTWCVPAGAQMALNIARVRTVRTRTEQARFYAFGRARNGYRYRAPGLDPTGAVAILRGLGGEGSYRDIRSDSFSAMLKVAVTRMRKTGRPVMLFVGNGSHAWVLNGFRATADPARTTRFTVTDVYVSGPLWPKERRRNGWWDLPPNTRLHSADLQKAYGRYVEPEFRTRWTGKYVAVVP